MLVASIQNSSGRTSRLGQHHQGNDHGRTPSDRLAAPGALRLLALAGLLQPRGLRWRQRRPEQLVPADGADHPAGDGRPARRDQHLSAACRRRSRSPAARRHSRCFPSTPRCCRCARTSRATPSCCSPPRCSSDTTRVTMTVQDALGQAVNVAGHRVAGAPAQQRLDIRAKRGRLRVGISAPAQTGTVRVQVAPASGGAPLVGRQIRFDVVYGAFGLQHRQPGAAAGADAHGRDRQRRRRAGVGVRRRRTRHAARADARDGLTTGQQQIGNFTIVHNTIAGQCHHGGSRLGNDHRAPTTRSARRGFRVDYYIYGGTPPYTVHVDIPEQQSSCSTTS